MLNYDFSRVPDFPGQPGSKFVSSRYPALALFRVAPAVTRPNSETALLDGHWEHA